MSGFSRPFATIAGVLTLAALAHIPVARADVGQAAAFADVPLASWAYDAVEQLAKDGFLKGYPDQSFKGARPLARYEAAMLAYRATDAIEAQLTVGKSVERSDIDAANKLLAAFGNELQALERQVAALQKQADASDTALAATSALGAATAATVRRAQIHLSATFRTGAYGQKISANAGPLPEVFNGVTYGPAAALPSGIGTAPTGTSLAGSYTTAAGVVTPGAGPTGGLGWGAQPQYTMGQNTNTSGQYGHGLGMQYLNLSFGGTPDEHSQYQVQFTNLDRYSATNFYPQASPALCTTMAVGVAGAACSSANASALDADGYLNNFVRLQNMWYQYTSPGGIYVKVGKFQQDEGPKQIVPTQWGMVDYVNGARVGYRDARFNAQVG